MAQATTRSACSVPGCSCNAQKQPYLSFHSFPANGEVREQWVQAIRREEGPTFTIRRGCTYVCSRHFTQEDYVFGISVSRLKPGSVPSRFLQTEYTPKGKQRSVGQQVPKRPLTSARVELKEIDKKGLNLDHDYVTPSDIQQTSGPGGLEDLHVKEEQEELWENQESDIISFIVKSDDENEEFQSEDVIKIDSDSSETEDSDAESYWTSNETSEKLQVSAESDKHPNKKPHGCDFCSKRFNSRRDLSRHMFIHTGEKPFSCYICGINFIQKSNLRAHIRVHTGEKPFDCKLCTKCFRRNTDLKRHMTVHTGVKPFSCDVCEKKFSRKTHLQSHAMVHSGEKPFTCNVCGKQFKQKTYLKVHKRVHTGERPFNCDVCEQSFSHRYSLTVHRRIHAKQEKSLNCYSLRKGNKHVHVSSSDA